MHVLLPLFSSSPSIKKPHATAARREYIISNTIEEMKREKCTGKTSYSLVSFGNNGGYLLALRRRKYREIVFFSYRQYKEEEKKRMRKKN